MTVTGTLYDYNPGTGATTQLGTTTHDDGNINNRAKALLSFAITPSVTSVPSGHRLLWVFRANSKHNTQLGDISFYFDSTAATAFSSYCVTPPETLALDKSVSSLITQPGQPLTYTLRYFNSGTPNATSCQIVDRIPVGASYTAAILNGTAVTPASINGQDYTFNVNTVGAGSGIIAGSKEGTLTISVCVDRPLSDTISNLVNTATLSSFQTAGKVDYATTHVTRPNINIYKSSNNTLLVPGDIVTYTLLALNSGDGSASNVHVTD